MTEVARHMVRIRSPLEICCMALVTISVGQLIVAVRMARLALYGYVCSGQHELCRVVIECCRLPCCRCMACLALMTEVARNVVRIRSSLEIRRVALITIGIGQLIIAVCVTRLALNGLVCTRQYELCCVVIECCRLPCRRRMADGTILRESLCLMIRICCVCEIRSVTVNAGSRQSRIEIIGMAIVACR
jgi:hypothetical protein